MERAIQLGGTLLEFLTLLTLRLDALFLSRLTVLFGVRKLRPSDVVRGLCALAVFHKGLEIYTLRIETLRNQHGIVGPWAPCWRESQPIQTRRAFDCPRKEVAVEPSLNLGRGPIPHTALW